MTSEERLKGYHLLKKSYNYLYGDLQPYHSGNTIYHTEETSRFLFGFEAEKEDPFARHILERHIGDWCQETKSSQEPLPYGYKAQRDSSLREDSGYELISPVYDLCSDLYITHLEHPLLNFAIHGNSTVRCGGHITLSCSQWDNSDYKTKADQILPILYALYPYRAKTSGYARFKTKEDGTNRNSAVNVQSSKMEIRIFPQIKTLKQLQWRVNLLKILFEEYSLEATSKDIYKDLLNTDKPLTRHLIDMYKKEYGTKVLLINTYIQAYNNEIISWKIYHKVKASIPQDVSDLCEVTATPPVIETPQLNLYVHHNSEETPQEA